ncbi:MAG TPA: decarboxylating 6-phosphogluconate dehydrogenase [Holophagaceae bacterium]
MQIAMVGLGRMGMNMARRLLLGGHQVVGHDQAAERLRELTEAGGSGAASVAQLVQALARPRAIWLMLPAGRPVADTVAELATLLAEGDLVIDGGNSFYQDDLRHSALLGGRGIHYLDVGVSGGIWGLKEGYCLMIGGEASVAGRLEPVFRTLAPPEGFLHCGGSGAGHFAKMIHNGIEYGMMAAYGEGFAILRASPYGEHLDLAEVARLWNRGSVVRSWLLELAGEAFRKDPELASLQGQVADSGEGRWTVQQAIDTGVPAPVLAAALFQRFRSRMADPFADRLVAALRREFGGHAITPAGGPQAEGPPA